MTLMNLSVTDFGAQTDVMVLMTALMAVTRMAVHSVSLLLYPQ